MLENDNQTLFRSILEAKLLAFQTQLCLNFSNVLTDGLLTLKQVFQSFFLYHFSPAECPVSIVVAPLQSESMDTVSTIFTVYGNQKMAFFTSMTKQVSKQSLHWYQPNLPGACVRYLCRDMPRRITDVHLNINFYINCQDQDLRGNVLCLQTKVDTWGLQI